DYDGRCTLICADMRAADTKSQRVGGPVSGVDLPGRFPLTAPRYTSYPTADRFAPDFGPAAYRAAVARRQASGTRRPLALYLHLPFCRDVCYYCACNKIVTRNRARTEHYLRYLDTEIALQGALFRGD